jgi:ribonuclease HII
MTRPLTLNQLRDKYGQASEVSVEVLEQLRSDPRSGSQRLYQRIKNRMDRKRAEHDRMEGLFRFERELWQAGVGRVAGVDEVGIGPMAGPVVAAAVVFSPDDRIDGVDDSKRLDHEAREVLDKQIRQVALGISLGIVEPTEVDRINVYHAGLQAMRQAVEGLSPPPDHVLVDSRTIPDISIAQSSYDKGDTLSFSIAAASIVAKVFRDSLMHEMDDRYPGYGFGRHKGYCTPEHQEAVRRHGPTPIHRRSYKFIKEIRGEYTHLFYELLKQADSIQTCEDVDDLRLRLKSRRAELSRGESQKLHLVLRRRRARL